MKMKRDPKETWDTTKQINIPVKTENMEVMQEKIQETVNGKNLMKNIDTCI